MRIQNHFYLFCLTSVLLTLISYPVGLAQDRKNAIGATTMREPNVSSPDLYAERLKLKVTLASLLGAGDPKSVLEATYQIYFVPEGEYYSVLDGLAAGGQSVRPSQFPRKILLADGTIRKTTLGTTAERTFWSNDIDFKARIPERERTKFGRLLTSYSVKIYDAQLKLPLYHSGVFLTYIFEKPTDRSRTVSPRRTLYLNFSVTPQGTLSYSQQPTP